MYGSDAHLSSEPSEFKDMVEGIRKIDKALNSNYEKDDITKSLDNMKETFEKYVVTKIDLKKNTIIKEEHLDYKKSSEPGILAFNYKEILGKKLNIDVSKNNLIKKNHLV
jgi:sialic acid synthase SpsE